jgi:hypothetical protein
LNDDADPHRSADATKQMFQGLFEVVFHRDSRFWPGQV